MKRNDMKKKLNSLFVRGALLERMKKKLHSKVYRLKPQSGSFAVGLLLALITTFNLPAQTLNDYLKISAENNPALKAKYAEYEASVQRIAQVKGLQDPVFSVSAFGQMVETRTGQQMAQFNIEQMFPWFGTLKAKGDVAALEAEARLKNFIEARNVLFLEVKRAYYALAEIDEMKKLRLKNTEILAAYKSLATSRFQQGRAPLVDVVRVNIAIEQVNTDIKTLDIEHNSRIAEFNKILNRNLTDEVVFNEPLSQSHEVTFNQDSLSINPRVVAMDRMIEAADMQQKAAKKEGMPMLGLGFNYIIIDERMDEHVEDSGKDAYMPMFTVSLPLYRKKYKAMVKEAEFMQQSYQMMRNEEMNSLHAEYTIALNQLNAAKLQYEMYHHHVESTNQAIQLLLSAVESSDADLEEVLNMQEELLMHEEGKVKALTAASVATANLEYLNGDMN